MVCFLRFSFGKQLSIIDLSIMTTYMMLKSFRRSDGWWVQILLMAYFTSYGSPSHFGFVCFAHGLGMGKGMGSNHHPFLFFLP
jgi:hypothetical protein